MPPEYHRPGSHPEDMAVLFIEHQKSAIGRLTRAFTGASDSLVNPGMTSQADEVTQSVKDLWKQKEEVEKKLAILALEKKEADAAMQKLKKLNEDNARRIGQLREFATTVGTLTGNTVPVSVLVEIAEDVLSKTA